MLLAMNTGASNSTYTLLPFTVPCGLLGGVLVAARPRNPVGWGFALTGVLFALGLLADQYAEYGLHARPGSLPVAEFALWLQSWVFQPAIVLILVIVPLYFPDGRLPSERWRWVARTALALMAAIAALTAVVPSSVRLGDSTAANPYNIDALHALGWVPDWALGMLTLGLGVAAVTSLVLRFLRAEGEKRQQIKWLALALALVTMGLVVDALMALTAPALYPAVFPVLQLIPIVVVVAATIAILRHRLFDIDVLINRTLVYGALTSSLVAGYVLVVGWLGTVFQARGSVATAVIATGLVAVAFAPLRDRLQRIVNRLLYGARDEPYRLLTLLGRRLEGTLAPEAVPAVVVDTVSEALKLPYAAVEIGRAGLLVTVAEHGQRPSENGSLVHLPLAHGGEAVGRLTLAPRGRREVFSAADRRVLDDLVRQIGTALHAVRMSGDLRRSREQLVVAREEERRRVGRDLHDGLGPQLASLTMKVETAHEIIGTDPHRARRLLSELLEQAECAIEEVRRVAYLLRPPVLDALGLLAALRAHAGDGQRVPVHFDFPQTLPALPAAVEVAAYRIVLEALHNVSSHAGASRCTVWLRCESAALRLEITDDGSGIPANHDLGVGLASMRERAAELGGSCTFESPPGGGTSVRAVLPVSTAVLVTPSRGS